MFKASEPYGLDHVGHIALVSCSAERKLNGLTGRTRSLTPGAKSLEETVWILATRKSTSRSRRGRAA